MPSEQRRHERKQLFDAHLHLLKSTDTVSRASSAGALSQYGPKAIPHLVESLKDQSLQVRMTAAKSLMKLGDERGISELIKLSIVHTPGRSELEEDQPRHREIWVAGEAKNALIQLAKGEHLPLLIKAHEEVETDEARKVIEEILEKVGGRENVG